jgi:hypothetical protein
MAAVAARAAWLPRFDHTTAEHDLPCLCELHRCEARVPVDDPSHGVRAASWAEARLAPCAVDASSRPAPPPRCLAVAPCELLLLAIVDAGVRWRRREGWTGRAPPVVGRFGLAHGCRVRTWRNCESMEGQASHGRTWRSTHLALPTSRVSGLPPRRRGRALPASPGRARRRRSAGWSPWWCHAPGRRRRPSTR